MPKKVKTESIPLFNHKFEAIRPFGPTVIRGTVPMDLIHLLDKKATKMLGSEQLSKEFNHAPNLAGNIKKEVRFPPSWMSTKEFKPVVDYIGEMVKAYISIPPANETDLDRYFREIKKDAPKLVELLRNIMVRRTRRYVLNQWGKEDESGRSYLQVGDEHKYFPKRKMKTERYDINKVYQRKYEKIVGLIDKESLTFDEVDLTTRSYK